MTLLKNSWVSWAPCSWAASPRAESTLKDSTRAPLNCSAASFTLCCCCSSIGSSSSFLLLACPDSFDGTLTVRAQVGVYYPSNGVRVLAARASPHLAADPPVQRAGL